MEDLTTQIPVWGLFALLVLDKAFNFVQKQREKELEGESWQSDKKEIDAERILDLMLNQIADLNKSIKLVSNQVNSTEDLVTLSNKKTDDLWEWHNMSDDEGVKVWYVRKSLEKAIDGLSQAITKQNEFFVNLSGELKSQKRDIDDIMEILKDEKKR